ncbi:N-acetylmuramoyl-L-alanine amidase [Bacillus sp. 1P06AnD]|uniref:N-acetylmuramoyl-L-alanine amidase n=1 Tax=Bacillus sp. 1P06AnD TaxID=3132208 RepID=UPI0039A08349
MKAVLKLCLSLAVIASGILLYGHSATKAAEIFSDIPASHAAYNEITYLAQGKIVSGDTSGHFNPKSSVTRAEAIAMVGRALNLDGKQRVTSFKDVGSKNFASGFIQSAVDRKIISGYNDKTFKPNGYVTRGEMAIMICKAFDYSFGNSSSGAAKALITRGIDAGLADGTFGFDQKSDRATTATFLARAINSELRTNPSVSYNQVKYVNTNALNVRKGPNANYASIGNLPNQTRVNVGYKVGTWALVKSDTGLTGFVSSTYLSDSQLPSAGGSSDDTSDNGSPTGPLASQTIVLDAGHGGKDPGNIGLNGIREKDVTLEVTLRLKTLFSQTPFNVKLTRESDVYPSLGDRVNFAQQEKANIFVSIHCNASDVKNKGKGTGTESFYYSSAANPNVSESKSLAKFVQDRLVSALDMRDRNVKKGDLHVLRENTMPAILTELGFLDNKDDYAKLSKPEYRTKAANAIFAGILDYYQNKGYDVKSFYSIAGY